MADTPVLIIGAGISGLSTAWWLAQQGIAVEVWEADGRPGGKIRSTHESGYVTERAAGLLVNFRPEIDQLIAQSGLTGAKCARPDDLNRYLVHQGRLQAVPMQFPALARSPLWSWQAKLRLLLEGFIPRGQQPDESASRFITRRLGKAILDTAFDPFIAGTLAADPEQAEARSVLPRLTALEQRYGSITLGVLINRLIRPQKRRANNADTFSFQGGMSDLIERLSHTPGVRLRYAMRVTEVSRDSTGWQVHARSGNSCHSRQVSQLVITTPADVTATLLSALDRPLSRLLAEIRYAPVATAHLGFAREQLTHPLDGTGFLVPRQANLNFNGNLWMSRLFPGRAPQGKVLLTSYLGGTRHPDTIDWSDEQIADTLLAQLTPLLGLKGGADYLRIDRHTQGLPLYHGRHQERVETIHARLTAHPGLHLNANYLDGVSVRDRIYQGSKTSRVVLAGLPRQAVQPATRETFALNL